MKKAVYGQINLGSSYSKVEVIFLLQALSLTLVRKHEFAQGD